MMRREVSALFVAASLALHAGALGGGAWLAAHARDAHRSNEAPANPTFAGDTFEIAATGEEAPQRVDEVVAAPTTRDGDETAREAQPRRRVLGAKVPSESRDVEAPIYGAIGDRSAVDLTVAVSRGFPQAASMDPIWRTAALGDAGEATMEIELAPDGTLARWNLGLGASLALRQAMARTMAFIGGRTFLARGAITKLRLTARITTEAVREGDDAVYAIHSEHEGANASAYFSLSIGRRVDLVIAPVK